MLQLHPHATVLVDGAAAAELQLREFKRQDAAKKQEVAHKVEQFHAP